MSWIKPAVCPLKGNTSWVVRPPDRRKHLIPQLLRFPSRLLGASQPRLDEGRRQHPRYRRVRAPTCRREDPLPGIEPHYVLGLGLEYRPLPSLLGRGFLRGKEARAHVGSLGA